MSEKLSLTREQYDELYHEITENFEEFVEMLDDLMMYVGMREVDKEND